MNKELDGLIELLSRAGENIIMGRHTDFAEDGKTVISLCFSIFPRIIVAYSDPKMADISEEATYWPGQLEKIVATLEGDDDFAAFDVLYNETRANLIYIASEIEKRGVTI